MGSELSTQRTRKASRTPVLLKVPTGIQGLDELTGGGLPKGRSTLLCGGAGSGKTLLAMEFLVKGVEQFGEPGIFVSFEEDAEELAQNFASLGHDLNRLVAQRKLAIDFILLQRSEVGESGDYNLEGLFIRLEHAIDDIGPAVSCLTALSSYSTG
jgi:circadian clock protein KaiC